MRPIRSGNASSTQRRRGAENTGARRSRYEENGSSEGMEMERIARWAKRVQPSNSKGGNWWQSPFCGAHTEKSAENTKVRRSRYEENGSSEGMEMERIARWAKRVQPSNSKGGNWWQSPFCGAHT